MSFPRVSKAASACFLVFAIMSVLVVAGVTDDVDRHALQVIGPLRGPVATMLMRAASWLGDGQAEVPLLLLVAGLLWRSGRGTSAWRYLAFAVSGEAFWALTKLLFHRPRPMIVTRLGEAGWYSYPSGHAMLAPVIWSVGLILLAELVASRAAKMSLWTLAVAIPIAIAVARVYLGVHYPTDVLAGLVLGVGWVFLWRVPVSAAADTARSV
jgi:undecaprenyl-diphosphatase